MCTVSWLFDQKGYHLFFNRDEQRERLKAEPPSIRTVRGEKALFPIDGNAQGTWIAANEHGVAFALLNYYQGISAIKEPRSRGLIIPSLLASLNSDDVQATLNRIKLTEFSPFSLLVFEPLASHDKNVDESRDQSEADRAVTMFRWDGTGLSRQTQRSPLVSSSVDFESVSASRREVYDSKIMHKRALQPMDFYRFHATHEPNRGASSVCMHREDARTVSFSHIAVGQHVVAFTYLDSAPCCSMNDGVEQGRNLKTVTMIRQIQEKQAIA